MVETYNPLTAASNFYTDKPCRMYAMIGSSKVIAGGAVKGLEVLCNTFNAHTPSANPVVGVFVGIGLAIVGITAIAQYAKRS